METTPDKRIVCIVGPTACHKTELSVQLALKTEGEIVSADSVQVYRGMDIGSAKPDFSERQGVLHHLLDCVSIDEADFSVSRYRTLAMRAIDDMHARGRTPIVVGGSGLYVNALTHPLGFAIPANANVRARIAAEFDHDPGAAYERLKKLDSPTAARLHPNDKKRVVRALEVAECAGRPLSSFGVDFHNEAGENAPYEPLLIGLSMDRAALYRRIERRVERMFEAGLLEEARRIYDEGYGMRLPAMQSIGYRQLFAYFAGDCTLEEARESIQRDTRRFAKRQMTWFRRDGRIRWYDVTNYDETADRLIAELTYLIRGWMKGSQYDQWNNG